MNEPQTNPTPAAGMNAEHMEYLLAREMKIPSTVQRWEFTYGNHIHSRGYPTRESAERAMESTQNPREVREYPEHNQAPRYTFDAIIRGSPRKGLDRCPSARSVRPSPSNGRSR